MKFVSFVRHGKPGFGALIEGDGIVDLEPVLGVPTLQAAIAAQLLPRSLDNATADFALSDVTLLPVVPAPSKILCVGLNFENHRLETKRPEVHFPTIFTRFADSQIAHGEALIKPRVSDRLDYEGELAVIIGRGGRYIAEGDAMAHIAGYACYNDGSIRDWQGHTQQFTPGKTFPGTGAFGPAMVDARDIDDYRTLRIRTTLNGQVMQDARLSEMIFSIPRIISYCSAFTPLSPGDVIVTGTPGGVGDKRTPPISMKAGDTVEVEIEKIGHLVNIVANEE